MYRVQFTVEWRAETQHTHCHWGKGEELRKVQKRKRLIQIEELRSFCGRASSTWTLEDGQHQYTEIKGSPPPPHRTNPGALI